MQSASSHGPSKCRKKVYTSVKRQGYFIFKKRRGHHHHAVLFCFPPSFFFLFLIVCLLFQYSSLFCFSPLCFFLINPTLSSSKSHSFDHVFFYVSVHPSFSLLDLTSAIPFLVQLNNYFSECIDGNLPNDRWIFVFKETNIYFI